MYKRDQRVCTCFIPIDPPSYNIMINNSRKQTVLEGYLNYGYQFKFEANPIPDSFNWTRNEELITGNRFSTTVSSTFISIVNRNDSGTYQVVSRNSAGMGMANFTLNVLCELCNIV